MSRYAIGIDLGTTNSALAYVDRSAEGVATRIHLFHVPQHIAPSEVHPRPLLPSFIYLAGAHEMAPGALDLPFGEPRGDTVGELARRQGAVVPARLVSSAKSWLCHDRVDRRADILPWHADEDTPRISPVAAAARVLIHFRDAWDAAFAQGDDKARFCAQDVIITVPASFDAVAQRLTLEAAEAVGVEKPILLEEPQAALYAWIATHEAELGERLPKGARVLVVDVGGGTTDFTVVRVEGGDGGEEGEESEEGEDAEENADVSLRRAAVSDHLLLGGDNMDLAIARRAAARIKGKKRAADWQTLRHVCRDAKERLLGEDPPESVSVAIAGRGSKLVGKTRSTEVTREEVEELVLQGFVPLVERHSVAEAGDTEEGLQEIGLPFASDPAITRHLGAFLERHADEGEDLIHPTAVLFNGGVMQNDQLRERVLEQLERWTGQRPEVLESVGFNLAVARGAAYYGLVREGAGVRILSGMPRAYYVGLDAGDKQTSALCLIPRGLEPGHTVSVDPGISLRANVAVRLPFFSSSVRTDAAGAVVPADDLREGMRDGAMRRMPPLLTALRAGRKRSSVAKEVGVELTARLTELGALEVGCHATDGTDRTWNLELQVRDAIAIEEVEADAPPGLDPDAKATIGGILAEAFADAGGPHSPLKSVARKIEELLDEKRETWSIPVCRDIFELALAQRKRRKESPQHEARFFNLAALCLRPGFGAALDDHRVATMWKLSLQGLAHEREDSVRLEWWIFHRRIAGGLKRGQQEQVLGRIRDRLLKHHVSKKVAKQEAAELWRLAASLEHVPAKAKGKLGDRLAELIGKGQSPPRWGWWSLGRLGARTPLYGPVNEAVAPSRAAEWVRRVLPVLGEVHRKERDRAFFAACQIARVTGDPSRDLAADLREEVAEALERLEADAALVKPLREAVATEAREERLLYGDSIPTGFKLVGAA